MTVTEKNYSNKKAKVSISPSATTTVSQLPSEAVSNKNEPEIGILLGTIISIVAGGGWLRVSDVLSIEHTCRLAKNQWCHNQGIWKSLVLIEWPNLLTTTTTITNSDILVLAGRKISNYRSIFLDPRLWLAAEAERVKANEKWIELTHYDVECGLCGCNCGGDECEGNPIESDFRWEKKEGKCLVFCEPCFEGLLVDKKSKILREDYGRVKGKNLFDIVTREIIEATTERDNDNMRLKYSNSSSTYYIPFFDSGSEVGWQKMHNNVEADDIAIVVANALVQDGCRTRHLQLDGIHYNHPGFGSKGYKALALALSINMVVERIDFYYACGDDCGCSPKSYAEDKSNGFFLKALQHNTNSALKELPLLCPRAFGPHTWKAWEKVKSNLRCGPLYDGGYNECNDYYDYVPNPDDEDEDIMESEEDNDSNDDDDDDDDDDGDGELEGKKEDVTCVE